MKDPKVSIIIPTKNSGQFIGNCLKSIKKQTYLNIEIVIVDNFSRDKTPEIAKIYTKNFYQIGPERSAQRNYGAKKSTGKYIFFVDSDMELSPEVVAAAVRVMEAEKLVGLVIPEESFGEGFWAACKKLERSFYVGIDFMEASRFFRKSAFVQVGGYDEDLISGEDWYLSQRLEKIGQTLNIPNLVYHNEGQITLLSSMRKKFYYAKHFAKYMNLKDNEHLKDQISITRRYALFLSHPIKLFKNPILGLGMLLMKTSEFAAGGVGYLLSLRG